MKSRPLRRLLLISGMAIVLVVATYQIAFEFPVIKWTYLHGADSKQPVLRPPTYAESMIRLKVCSTIEAVLVIGAWVFLRWYNGKEILPENKLLPIEGEPIKGELLMPLQGLGYCPADDKSAERLND